LLQKNPSGSGSGSATANQILAEKMNMLLELAGVIWEDCECSLLIQVAQTKK